MTFTFNTFQVDASQAVSDTLIFFLILIECCWVCREEKGRTRAQVLVSEHVPWPCPFHLKFHSDLYCCRKWLKGLNIIFIALHCIDTLSKVIFELKIQVYQYNTNSQHIGYEICRKLKYSESMERNLYYDTASLCVGCACACLSACFLGNGAI